MAIPPTTQTTHDDRIKCAIAFLEFANTAPCRTVPSAVRAAVDAATKMIEEAMAEICDLCDVCGQPIADPDNGGFVHPECAAGKPPADKPSGCRFCGAELGADGLCACPESEVA